MTMVFPPKEKDLEGKRFCTQDQPIRDLSFMLRAFAWLIARRGIQNFL